MQGETQSTSDRRESRVTVASPSGTCHTRAIFPEFYNFSLRLFKVQGCQLGGLQGEVGCHGTIPIAS